MICTAEYEIANEDTSIAMMNHHEDQVDDNESERQRTVVQVSLKLLPSGLRPPASTSALFFVG